MGRFFRSRRDDDAVPTDGEKELEELRKLRGAHTDYSAADFASPAAASHAAPKARRRWPRRLLIGFNILLATALLAGIAGAGYVKWQFGRISKLDLNGILDTTGGSKDPMTILLVGSDSRENLAAGESKSFGSAKKVGGQRSDTIMLLHIDPKTKQAAILSLPRDLYVTIAGTNGKGKINSAFDGGPSRLIETIKKNFNIPIDHYIEVDFDGFKGIVNAIGGVQVPFSAPVRDWGFDEATGSNRNLSGLDIRQTGCVNLDGTQALSYVRSRHYQVYESGRWISDPQSDITRIQRQQDFIRRVMRKSVSKGSTNPVTLNSLISNGVKNVQFDKGLDLGDFTRIARQFQPLDPARVQMMTMPSRGSSVGGASVLLVKDAEAKQTIDLFLGKTSSKDDTSANVPVESISVRVLNGSGVSGQASQASSDLSNVGFVRGGVGDTRVSSVTTIRYATSTKSKAQTLAKYIGGTVNLVEDPTIKGVDTILVLGKNFSGIVDPSAPTTTTSTTTPPTTKAQATTTTTDSPFVPSADDSC